MNKYDYDIVVVGAGPCGSWAAKVAAEKGAKTIVLEEHPQIGLPEHCAGMVGGTSSGFLEKLIETIDGINKRVVITKLRTRRVYAPNGKMIEQSLKDIDVYVIERNLFDLQLAKEAALAGAEIVVNARVTGLLHEDGVIKGVTTSLRTMPEIRSKIVIAADGLRALLKGIASWEELSRAGQQIGSGIKLHLAGVKDIEPGIVEFHLGSFCESGWGLLIPLDNVSCYSIAPSMMDFETIKAGNWVISKKLRDCRVLRMTGWFQPIPLGMALPKKVKDGLILAGDAAGFIGVDFAVVTGAMAAEVAVKAIEEGDFTETKLGKYEELCQELKKGWYDLQFFKLEAFSGGLSDEEIQKLFDERQPDV